MKTVQDLKAITTQLLNNYSSLLDKEHSAANKLQKEAFLVYSLQTLTRLDALLRENINHKLKEFLAENWALINGTAMSYTNLSNDALTELLCDIAQYVYDNNPEENSSALKILMPTVSPEAINENPSYPNLDTLDLRLVLKTHILGKKGQYLIPVKKFNELLNSTPTTWFNQYYDGFNELHADMVMYDQEEYTRLTKHSPETIALLNAHQQYELCVNQQNSLLAHLNQLCRHLSFNSAQGVGKEDNAGTGVYDALLKFRDYYNRLAEDIKKKIPTSVKSEIEFLLSVAFDAQVNTNATKTLSTCIHTRRSQLKNAMALCEEALSKIDLSDEDKANLVKEKKQQVKDCEAALSTALKEPSYRGNDALGLTKALMKKLNLSYSIASVGDIQDLIKLSNEEFAEIYKDRTLRQQLIAQFLDLDNFIIFVHDTPLEKLKIILEFSGSLLAKQLINKPEDILALLFSFNKEQCELICSAMIASVSSNIITTAKQLESVLGPLSSEQRSPVFKIINENPAAIFKVSELTYYLEFYFPDNEQKRKIQQRYFNGLLESILLKCATLQERGFVASHDLGVVLVNNLKKASLGFFGDEKTKPSLNYDQFNQSCKEAINNADDLRRYHNWVASFIELAICVASFGIIPLVLSVTNKLTQGTWSFRFFDTVTAKDMDKVLAFSHEAEEMMSLPALS